MVYTLKIESEFDAAHKLVGYVGPCSRIHGHSWTVKVYVKGDKLNNIGMLIDFKILKKKLKLMLEKFDHYCLNDIVDFNPTAENLARYCYYYMCKAFKETKEIEVDKVRVYESKTAYCEFSDY